MPRGLEMPEMKEGAAEVVEMESDFKLQDERGWAVARVGERAGCKAHGVLRELVAERCRCSAWSRKSDVNPRQGYSVT